ncbi:hypothetical protein MMPV_000461 [Pyropia vietnamensis]
MPGSLGGLGGSGTGGSASASGGDSDILAEYKAVVVDRVDGPGGGVGSMGGFALPVVGGGGGGGSGNGGSSNGGTGRSDSSGGDTRRVSIGLDWAGARPAASGRTWTGTTDDYGRSLSEDVNDYTPAGGHVVVPPPVIKGGSGLGGGGLANGVAVPMANGVAGGVANGKHPAPPSGIV